MMLTRRWRGRWLLASAATTPTSFPGRRGSLGPRQQLISDEIQSALRRMTIALYGRSGGLESAELDAALAGGTLALQKLVIVRRWPARVIAAVRLWKG